MQPDPQRAPAASSSLWLRLVEYESLQATPLRSLAEAKRALAWEIEPINVSWGMEKRTLTVHLPFFVFLRDRRENVCSICVSIQSTYDVRPKARVPAADDIDHYVGIGAVLHAWPYLRAQVQYLSTQLGMTPIVLPVIVAAQLPEVIKVKRWSQGVVDDRLPGGRGGAAGNARAAG
ncbi:MAG: hypothetical protein ACRENE_23350 [Polyangiaceae bacterium]